MTAKVEGYDQLLTRAEAAKFLGNIKTQTLSAWACNHRYHLPFIRIGRLVRYRRSDLERWMQARIVNAVPEDQPAPAPKIYAGK